MLVYAGTKRSPRLGAAIDVSEATVWKVRGRDGRLLAAWAPGLREALTGRGEDDFVILDGTLIPTDRVAADEPYYSQKYKKHGMNVPVAAAPDGTPMWFSRVLPGRAHDPTNARAHGVIKNCHALADPRPGRPRLPGCRRHRPHSLLPPPRTA